MQAEKCSFTTKQLFDQGLLPVKFQSSVQANFILDVREGSVEGIRRIRNLEVRVTFEGEEKWKVALCALVGAPDSAMGVVPFACGFIRSFRSEEHTSELQSQR